MKAVIYNNMSGRIVQLVTGSAASIEKTAEFGQFGWLEINRFDPTIGITHLVLNGQLTERPISDVEAERHPILMGQLRMERDRLLASSDWTQLPDRPEAFRTAWASYRQALRDLPETTNDPAQIVWPTPPEASA